MSIYFETHTLPDALTETASVSAEDTNEIVLRLQKSNRRLSKKMNAIDRREKRTWQKSSLRN